MLKLSFYIFFSNEIYVIFRFNALSIVRKRQKITFYTVVKPSLFAQRDAFALPFQDVGCSALEFNINARFIEGFHRCLRVVSTWSVGAAKLLKVRFDVHKLLLIIVFKVSNKDSVHWYITSKNYSYTH